MWEHSKIKQPVCDEAYRLLVVYNFKESSASSHLCKFSLGIILYDYLKA